MKVSGGCHCGNIRFELELTHEPGSYGPRACDCDFCTRHAAAYVSDPWGSLSIRIGDERNINRYRQGSEQAEFLICAHCGVLTAVLYKSGEGHLLGAVNAKAVEGGKPFDAEQPVSPRRLSAEEKVKRWQEVWFHSVSIAIVGV